MNTLVLRAASVAVVLSAVFLPVYLHPESVFAHVHAVTPLNDCSVDNAEHSGGRVILYTPAAVENGGPIQNGPIPLKTGNAAFDLETGGGNHAAPRCP